MKLQVSQKRIEANRQNGLLGARARQKNQAEKYQANPSYCRQCNSILPQAKKRNLFCNQSCAAIFNNTGRIKVSRHPCAHCSKPTLNKFCSRRCGWESQKIFLDPNNAEQYKKIKKKEVTYRYYQRLKDQTPPNADLKAIREFYDNCPPGYEVDHIIPISRGGLHTLSNLQYLTIRENRQKSNKMVHPVGIEPTT